MFTINSCTNGSSMEVSSYDRAIEILDMLYGESYSIIRDETMHDVWWISVCGDVLFMLTNLQRVGNVQVE